MHCCLEESNGLWQRERKTQGTDVSSTLQRPVAFQGETSNGMHVLSEIWRQPMQSGWGCQDHRILCVCGANLEKPAACCRMFCVVSDCMDSWQNLSATIQWYTHGRQQKHMFSASKNVIYSSASAAAKSKSNIYIYSIFAATITAASTSGLSAKTQLAVCDCYNDVKHKSILLLMGNLTCLLSETPGLLEMLQGLFWKYTTTLSLKVDHPIGFRANASGNLFIAWLGWFETAANGRKICSIMLKLQHEIPKHPYDHSLVPKQLLHSRLKLLLLFLEELVENRLGGLIHLLKNNLEAATTTA